MAGWTPPLPHVGHVALVVRAIEMSAIPARREDNVEMEGFAAGAGEDVRRARIGERKPQSQYVTRMRWGSSPPSLRRSCAGRSGRGGPVRGRSVGSRPLRESARSASIPGAEREPNTQTDRRYARTSFRPSATMRRSRKRSSSGSRRTCGNGRSRPDGIDDGVVRSRVGKAAAVDELHTE